MSGGWAMRKEKKNKANKCSQHYRSPFSGIYSLKWYRSLRCMSSTFFFNRVPEWFISHESWTNVFTLFFIDHYLLFAFFSSESFHLLKVFLWSAVFASSLGTKPLLRSSQWERRTVARWRNHVRGTFYSAQWTRRAWGEKLQRKSQISVFLSLDTGFH